MAVAMAGKTPGIIYRRFSYALGLYPYYDVTKYPRSEVEVKNFTLKELETWDREEMPPDDYGKDLLTITTEKIPVIDIYCDSVSWDDSTMPYISSDERRKLLATRDLSGDGSKERPYKNLCYAIAKAQCIHSHTGENNQCTNCFPVVRIILTGVVDYYVRVYNTDTDFMYKDTIGWATEMHQGARGCYGVNGENHLIIDGSDGGKFVYNRTNCPPPCVLCKDVYFLNCIFDCSMPRSSIVEDRQSYIIKAERSYSDSTANTGRYTFDSCTFTCKMPSDVDNTTLHSPFVGAGYMYSSGAMDNCTLNYNLTNRSANYDAESDICLAVILSNSKVNAIDAVYADSYIRALAMVNCIIEIKSKYVTVSDTHACLFSDWLYNVNININIDTLTVNNWSNGYETNFCWLRVEGWYSDGCGCIETNMTCNTHKVEADALLHLGIFGNLSSRPKPIIACDAIVNIDLVNDYYWLITGIGYNADSYGSNITMNIAGKVYGDYERVINSNISINQRISSTSYDLAHVSCDYASNSTFTINVTVDAFDTANISTTEVGLSVDYMFDCKCTYSLNVNSTSSIYKGITVIGTEVFDLAKNSESTVTCNADSACFKAGCGFSGGGTFINCTGNKFCSYKGAECDPYGRYSCEDFKCSI